MQENMHFMIFVTCMYDEWHSSEDICATHCVRVYGGKCMHDVWCASEDICMMYGVRVKSLL